MQTKNKPSSFSNVSDVQVKLFGFVGKSLFVEKEKPDRLSVYQDSKGVWNYDTSFCKHCNSRKVTKHRKNSRTIINNDGAEEKIFVKRYYCKKCGKTSQTEFLEDYDPYCKYPKKIKDVVIDLIESGHQTLRQQVDTLLITMKFKHSHETVRKYRIKDESLYYFNEDLELSGYYGYDAQWVDSIKKWDYRLVLFDLINKMPVAELLSDNEDSQTVKKFIEESIPSQKRKAIVTDLKPEYDKIMEELGFDHQHCIFHLRLNINKYIREFISEKKSEIRRDYVKNNPNASKSKIKVFVDKKVKEIKKEINIYNELFFELFNQQSYEKAIGFINLLKFEIKNFPEPLKNYLTNNFFPVYKKFLHFLKEKHYGKLDRTNNQTENYIGNTLPKSLKNKYRTRTELFNYIKHQINRRIKNRKNPLTT